MRCYLVKTNMAVIEREDGVYYHSGVITDIVPEEYLRALSRVNDVTGWEDDLTIKDILEGADEYEEMWT